MLINTVPGSPRALPIWHAVRVRCPGRTRVQFEELITRLGEEDLPILIGDHMECEPLVHTSTFDELYAFPTIGGIAPYSGHEPLGEQRRAEGEYRNEYQAPQSAPQQAPEAHFIMFEDWEALCRPRGLCQRPERQDL